MTSNLCQFKRFEPISTTVFSFGDTSEGRSAVIEVVKYLLLVASNIIKIRPVLITSRGGAGDEAHAKQGSEQAFHKTFASAVAVRRPNIWVFLRVLKDQQALSENTFEAVRRGELPPRRRKKWRNLEERLQELKRQYNTGARNLDQFWSALTYLVPHP
ncbi:hypothetical protein ACOMHN_035036 [Nucella lapillus]